MARRKLTPWFTQGELPAHRGVYFRTVGYSYWNGERWFRSADAPRRAALELSLSTLGPSLPWRGLTERAE